MYKITKCLLLIAIVMNLLLAVHVLISTEYWIHATELFSLSLLAFTLYQMFIKENKPQ